MVLSAPGLDTLVTTQQRRPTPNAMRLLASLEAMAEVGLQPDGSICRRGFSAEDRQGRERLSEWMIDAGLSLRIDAAGNLIGRLEGLDPSLPALVTGSHLDTVPTGGRYDGTLGVLAGLELVRSLQDASLRLRHPFELIVFADEESTMVGCKGMAGTASGDPSDYATSNGEPIQRNLARLGGDWERLASAARSDDAIAAFVELHVEQGAVLERRGDSIGVVQGVVGQRRFTIRVSGQANHAGTTPMDQRQDALVAASQVVLAVQALALEHPGDPVATVGKFEVWPNAANVVPGEVQCSVDLRDLDPEVLSSLTAELQRRLAFIAEATACSVTMDPQFSVDPTPAAPVLMDAIADAARELGLSHSPLPSRASHDAQELGRRWPMGMVFVPSHRGLSHSSAEYTSLEQCVAGTSVLLSAFLRLDAQLQG
ncbi:Zn-dependent hydrolase [Synechococcus sp. A10-1-5-1]|uniref:Zn-dependent hydrolase n=1 Tax=Synechococcus sp. A10-1-5-1 TaxID=2936507 RepID=UPI002000DF36|nr:Zn-dependent hydrolase [Synechococcus sp. A10-1-5-1]UPM50154.1 Zn-dependent hydrolase [Synechococcus sp. A10-1-5-1]